MMTKGRKPQRTGKWWLKRMLILAIILYLGLNLFLWAFQRFLVFPGTIRQNHWSTRLQIPTDCKRLDLTTADGTPIVGMFYPALGSTTKPTRNYPTILAFYGNAQCIAFAQYEIDLYRRCGANVLIVDYPGFGQSQGKASEVGLYQAADALWQYASQSPDLDPHRLVAAGWSLGGAAAIDLASRKPLAGLITLSSFTSLPEMAHRQFPIIPTSLLLRYQMASLAKIPSVHCPTLIIHGQADNLIPVEMSQRLYAASGATTRQFLEIAGAQHNDIFATGYFQISQAITTLLQNLPPASAPLSAPTSAPAP